jgi:D-threo-aldose 1-dehydrogenase
LQARAARFGVPLATAALQFGLHHKAAASVLLGTAKPSSLTRNLEAAFQELPAGIETLLA